MVRHVVLQHHPHSAGPDVPTCRDDSKQAAPTAMKTTPIAANAATAYACRFGQVRVASTAGRMSKLCNHEVDASLLPLHLVRSEYEVLPRQLLLREQGVCGQQSHQNVSSPGRSRGMMCQTV